jgi:hypothetical protein
MHQVHSMRTFKYAQHRTVQLMGHFWLPVVGFGAMSEILHKQIVYGSQQDKNALSYFLIPSGVQIGSSTLRHTITQSFPQTVNAWRPTTAHSRSMGTLGALLVKDYISHQIVDNFHEQKSLYRKEK